MNRDPILRAMLRSTFVDGGLMMIGIAVGIGIEKLAQLDPTLTVDGSWFGRAGMLMLALWLPLLFVLKRLEQRGDHWDEPDQTRH